MLRRARVETAQRSRACGRIQPGLTRRRDSSRYTETAREWTQKFAVRARAARART
jgi:hypothetical protein